MGLLWGISLLSPEHYLAQPSPLSSFLDHYPLYHNDLSLRFLVFASVLAGDGLGRDYSRGKIRGEGKGDAGKDSGIGTEGRMDTGSREIVDGTLRGRR